MTDTEAARCKYDHLQFFVDELKPLSHYKAIEERLNAFAKAAPPAAPDAKAVAAAKKKTTVESGR